MAEQAWDLNFFKAELEGRVSAKRFAHSCAVADYALELAVFWRQDPEKAYLAGLLHDFEQGKSDAELLSAAVLHGVPVGDVELAAPILLHGPLAAAVLADQYGIDDEDVLEAISCHTVPSATMGALAKIVYLADMAEPTRPVWPGQEKLRSLAKTNLDAAMAFALARSLAYLQQQGKTPHPDTERLQQQYEAYAAQHKAN